MKPLIKVRNGKSSGTDRPYPKFDWFIPVDGDGVHIGTRRAERPPTFEYLRSVVETAENHGFHSMLIPTRFANGLFEESAPLAETWTMVTALAAVTEKIRFLVAVRPGFLSTGLFAQMAATLNQISGGRLDINVVPGGIQGDFERFGEVSGHQSRYERAEEFMAACRKLWESPEPVVFNGTHVTLNGALCSPVRMDREPKFYTGGASQRALELAGRAADTYLLWIGPLDKTAEHIEKAREQFAAAGRHPSFGMRTHLIVRDTENEAWEAAEELLSQADNDVRNQRDSVFAGTPMVGQRIQSTKVEGYKLGAHLWNGISQVRVNCGTAIVGNPEQVAGELLEYWSLGIDEFILSGFPHIEECDRVVSDVIPILEHSINHQPKPSPP